MNIVECEHCQHRWNASTKQVVLECPHCYEVTGYRIVGKKRILRAKGTFDGARTIQEMAFKLRARGTHLKKLADKGWKLQEEVHDDYAYLWRGLSKEEKEKHTIEVVVPTENDGYDGLTEEEMEEKSVEKRF